MDWVIICLLIIIAIIISLLLFQDKIFNRKIRASAIKKDQIADQYKKELEELLKKYNNDKDEQLKQKKLFLQKVTSELSRNIYFTASDNKKLIQSLATL